MAIRILENTEPRAAGTMRTQAPILAESDAYRILKHELQNYLEGQVNGRSFLIAGHRGAGKTTVVVGTIEETKREWRNLSQGLRPMMVMLHGPNLLPNRADEEGALPSKPAKPQRAGNETHGGTEEGAQAESRDSPLDPRSVRTQKALIQITLSLYRTLAREFCDCFRERVMQQIGDAAPGKTRDLLELATQLEMELDDFPEPARLREIWRRAGFLETGVLFPPRPAKEDPFGLIDSEFGGQRADQGLRELLALTSTNKAYERIESQLNAKRTGKDDENQKRSSSVDLDSKGANLVQPAVTVIAGALGGAAALSQKQDALAASIAALAGVLGSSLVFKFSSSRSRERSVSWEYSAVRDLTIGTLDRVLPELIIRIRGAGLAPVFVVDELDKVDNLSDLITDLVRHLKKFVAESAFFCFLTDRTYYESMRQREAIHPYPIEYTYFTHQLFLAFSPHDLHVYLGRILEHPDLNPQRGTDDISDHAVLPYILLHESQMHAIDLRRSLVQLRSTDGTVKLRPGVVRTHPSYRCDLTLQIAIESLAEQPILMRRLDRDPAFRRLVHDALYYPSREWRAGKLQLDVTEETLAAYLAKRMMGDEPNIPTSGPAAANANGNADENHPVPNLSDGDRRLLVQQAQRLAELLADPDAFSKHLEGYEAERKKLGADFEIPSYVRAAVLREESSTAGEPRIRALLCKTGEHQYEWLLDCYGRALSEPAQVATNEDWERDSRTIDAVSAMLTELAGTKTNFTSLSNLGLLTTTPAWTEAKSALNRLRIHHRQTVPSMSSSPIVQRASGSEQDELQRDTATVREFAAMLSRHERLLQLAFAAAALVGRAAEGSREERLQAGLEAICGAFELNQLSESAVLPALSKTWELLEASPWFSGHRRPAGATSIRETEEWVRSLTEEVRQKAEPPLLVEQLKAVRDTLERLWIERVEKSVEGAGQKSEPVLEDLLGAAARVPIACAFKLDLGKMTLSDWGDALAASLRAMDRNGKEEQLPAWVGSVALAMSGLPALAKALLGNVAPEPKLIRLFLRMDTMESPIPGRTAVVIREMNESIAARWMPTARSAAIAVTLDDLEVLAARRGSDFFKDVGLVFIEPRVESQRTAFRALTRATPLKRVFSIGSPSSKTSESQWPFLGNPPSLDAAIDMVQPATSAA